MVIRQFDVLPSPIPTDFKFTVDLPFDAKVLSVAMQDGKPRMWVLLDTEHKTVPREFFVARTGTPLPAEIAWRGRFVGTWLIQDGRWLEAIGTIAIHLFEVPSLEP